MQYHKIKPGQSKQRISRTEFIKAYNDSPILAINPLQLRGQDTVFQFEFYVDSRYRYQLSLSGVESAYRIAIL